MIFKLAVILSILSLLAGYPVYELLAFPLEVNGSFPHLHFLFGIASLIYFFWRKDAQWIVLCIVGIVVQSTNLFWPLTTKIDSQFLGGVEVKILYSNIFVHNTTVYKLRELVENEKPNLVFLTEVSDNSLESLNLDSLYPYFYKRPGKSADGNAIYSSFPLLETKRIPENTYFAALSARVELEENKEIYVNLVHAPPPQLDFSGGERRDFFFNLANQIGSKIRPNMIVLGDFNVASSVRLMSEILDELKMRLDSNGWMVMPTWRIPELRFIASPIDHIALGDGVEGVSYRIGPDIGSDHLPLLATIRIR